jgi:pyrrolidone-carboxylate peptidase
MNRKAICMVKLPLSEFTERINVAQDMLREAYPDNAAVEQLCEAIALAGQVVFHMSVPFQNIVEEKLDIQR